MSNDKPSEAQQCTDPDHEPSPYYMFNQSLRSNKWKCPSCLKITYLMPFIHYDVRSTNADH